MKLKCPECQGPLQHDVFKGLSKPQHRWLWQTEVYCVVCGWRRKDKKD